MTLYLSRQLMAKKGTAMADSTAGRNDDELRAMTAAVVAAYVSKNQVAAAQIAELIEAVYHSFRAFDGKAAAPGAPGKPAVPVKKSITPEFLICLEDGKKLKMLKRHLRTAYNLTPDAYRKKWGLSADYPMVAPNYAQARSAFAKRIGLGRGRGAAKRGRRKAD
jgi:predicted transcriptional regulator